MQILSRTFCALTVTDVFRYVLTDVIGSDTLTDVLCPWVVPVTDVLALTLTDVI